MTRKLTINRKGVQSINVIANPVHQVKEPERVNSIDGRLIDGYVRYSDIRVFDDQDKPIGMGVSLQDGSFDIQLDRPYTGVLTMHCVGGIDIATEKPFFGQIKTKINKTTLDENVTGLVTPITTIVNDIIDAEESVVDQQLLLEKEQLVADSLGLTLSDVTTDHISINNIPVAKRVGQLAAIIKLVQQSISSDTDKKSAAESVRAVLASTISQTEVFDPTDTQQIKQIIDDTAQHVTDNTQYDIVDSVTSTSIQLANSIQVITDTIEQVNESIAEDQSPAITADTALSAIMLIGSVVDNIVNGDQSIVDVDAESLTQLIDQAQVYKVQLPRSEVPETPYIWTRRNWPIMEDYGVCVGDEYITVEWLKHWRCTTGQFDADHLARGVLKRTKGLPAGASQAIDLQQNDYIVVEPSGLCQITFEGGSILWRDNGSTSNTRLIDDNYSFKVFSSPERIIIELMEDSHVVEDINLISMNANDNILLNNNFLLKNIEYYHINGWYLDQDDWTATDPYSIGFISGWFASKYDRHTMFQGPVTEIG